MVFFADNQLDSALHQSTSVFKRITDSFFNAKSLLALAISLTLALLLGRLLATIMRKIIASIGAQADKARDINRVNKLRRLETLLVLSIALVRTALFIAAIYFWWVYVHPNGQPTAIIGASAVLAILISGALSPVLRDLAYGGVMMAEHWFGVGDFVRIEPFADLQGVVERVTLRSTKIRGLNGEITWISNQNIAAVRITPKGVRTIALELLVSNLEKGMDLIEETNLRLPTSPLMLVSPLTVMTKHEAGNNLWHITAIGETAPGREWILENYALKIVQEIDEDSKHPVLLHEPITRYADSDAERRFARTLKNAHKNKLKKPASTPKTLAKRRARRLIRQ